VKRINTDINITPLILELILIVGIVAMLSLAFVFMFIGAIIVIMKAKTISWWYVGVILGVTSIAGLVIFKLFF